MIHINERWFDICTSGDGKKFCTGMRGDELFVCMGGDELCGMSVAVQLYSMNMFKLLCQLAEFTY